MILISNWSIIMGLINCSIVRDTAVRDIPVNNIEVILEHYQFLTDIVVI